MGALDTCSIGLDAWSSSAGAAQGVVTWFDDPVTSMGISMGTLSPDSAKAHLDRVNVSVRALSSDILAYLKTATKPLEGFEAWDAWLSAWLTFYENATPWNLFINAGEIDNETTKREEELKGFYTRFQAQKVPEVMPPPTPAPAGDAPGSSNWGDTVKLVFYGVGAVAGVASVGYLINAVKK